MGNSTNNIVVISKNQHQVFLHYVALLLTNFRLWGAHISLFQEECFMLFCFVLLESLMLRFWIIRVPILESSMIGECEE